jgi:hypothetical protein
MAEVHMPHAARPDESQNVHTETSDVDIRGILGFGAALVVAAVIIHVAIWVLFRYFDAREARHVVPVYPLAAAPAGRFPPEPRLQTNPRQDLRDLRAREDEILRSYGWVDRNAGIVRIPIDEAMRLTVQRGLPARSTGAQR